MVFYCAFPRSSPNTWPIDWSTAEPLHMENNAGLSCNLRGGITQWLLIFNFSFLSLHNLCSYCKHFWSRHIDSFGVWVPGANTLKSKRQRWDASSGTSNTNGSFPLPSLPQISLWNHPRPGLKGTRGSRGREYADSWLLLVISFFCLM